MGAILLFGLPDKYDPLVMGIDSKEKLKGDAIISKLLATQKPEAGIRMGRHSLERKRMQATP